MDWGFDPSDVTHKMLIDLAGDRSIYRCRWRHTTVCMKVIDAINDDTRHELEVLSKSVHPNICQFLGGCTLDGKTFMLFEYMDNGNLRQYLSRREPSVTEKISIALYILAGLDYLARRRPRTILHRDIKPDNIFINAFGVAKIGDFGSSKLVDQSNDASSRVHTGEVGTYRWTAPEILRSSLYDATADIYSFGLLLRYIWSGVLPYRSYTKPVQVVFAKISNTADDYSDLILPESPDASFEIKRLVEQCTDFDSLARPTIAIIFQRLESLRAVSSNLLF